MNTWEYGRGTVPLFATTRPLRAQTSIRDRMMNDAKQLEEEIEALKIINCNEL